MAHDPMCVDERLAAVNALPCYCALIARVREDERESLPADSVAEGVRLLQTIGLDITYTDEALAVIARQTLRMGRADAARDVAALPEEGPAAPDPGIDERQAYALAESYQNGVKQGQRVERKRIRAGVMGLDAFYAIEECQGNPLEKGDPNDPDPWLQGHLLQRDEVLAVIVGGER